MSDLITIEHDGLSLTLTAEEWLRRARARNFKFADRDCAYILRLYEGYGWPQKTIARRYGVSRRTIVRACQRARKIAGES